MSLENKIVLMPTSPESNHMVQDITGRYDLLVEREMVSFNGDECNKIGTSYEAFNNQPGSACSQPLGSCLSNQISNLYEEDILSLQQGNTPRYILKQYGADYAISPEAVG